jgi:hypothetical protein
LVVIAVVLFAACGEEDPVEPAPCNSPAPLPVWSDWQESEPDTVFWEWGTPDDPDGNLYLRWELNHTVVAITCLDCLSIRWVSFEKDCETGAWSKTGSTFEFSENAVRRRFCQDRYPCEQP